MSKHDGWPQRQDISLQLYDNLSKIFVTDHLVCVKPGNDRVDIRVVTFSKLDGIRQQ